MERRAILIDASNVAGENDLPGARVDIKNWEEFLTSALGGGWKPSEIIVLRKPMSTDVTQLLTNHSNKYCIVAFSGHGSDGYIALNDYDKKCTISTLYPKGDRGVLVIDSCRGFNKARSFNSSIQKSAGVLAERAGGMVLANSREGTTTNFSVMESSVTPLVTREVEGFRYKSKLDSCDKGLVKMLSCSAGEGADEDPESGGYYTSAILDAAVAFERDTMKSGFLTTLQAHDYAAALMPSQQTPEYIPRTLEFPFAVK